MNRRKLSKMEVMQQGDVQVQPVGWPWIGHVAMELTGEDDDRNCIQMWIERPTDPSSVDRLVEACKEIQGDIPSSDRYSRFIDALAAVEKERGQDE